MTTLRAYAKINLGLRILQKRNDGYHDIETIFHRVDLFDEIMLEPAREISIRSSDPSLDANDENLCLRAAMLLQNESRTTNGIRISLNKKIPVRAGLGGGSSDAATTLRGLNTLWQLNFSTERLRSLALQLGSDVPFFLNSGTAVATGRGEILEYFHLDIPYWILLIYPNINVSTIWAYRNVSFIPTRRAVTLRSILVENIHRPNLLQNLIENDFEQLVFDTYPEIAVVKKQLTALGAGFVRMSGSGSSLYGFFTAEEEARLAARKMGEGFRVFLTPPHFEPPRIAP